MKVAIIGAGNVGKALGASIAKAGHEVSISARSPESAAEAAGEIGARAAETNVEAARDADLVILAIPYQAEAALADELEETLAGRAVVELSNPVKPDFSGLATATSAAEELQERLPSAKVVKAFNTVFASNQANPRAGIDVFVTGNDPDAKALVAQLAESVGFSALDVGPLSFARYLEGMAFVNIALNAQNGWSWISAWRLER